MGITDYAQGALGDIVYVQLPKVGETVVADKVCGEVESTKSVSEIFAPVSGKILTARDGLQKLKLRRFQPAYSLPMITVKLPRRNRAISALFSA
jgi:hypothetical protein